MKHLRIISIALFAPFAFSIELSSKDIKLGGFIDTYYAYDLNNPINRERQFTTQPARHNEFNINLAYIDLTVTRAKSRARLALQHGTSVVKNYGSEPTDGQNTQDARTLYGIDSRNIQEAYVGVKLAENLWVDMGIFLGNIGMESWISKDNWTYTRSLNLDYVPYYSSGAKLSYQQSAKTSWQFQLLNSWQTVQDNNQSKAFGGQFNHQFSDELTFTYNNFLGSEKFTTSESRFRTYHNFIFKYVPKDSTLSLLTSGDVGTQQMSGYTAGWFVLNAVVRKKLSEGHYIAFRNEFYSDPHGANVFGNFINPRVTSEFTTYSASINFDKHIDEYTLWRTEIRTFKSKNPIFPKGSNSFGSADTILVTSLAVSF